MEYKPAILLAFGEIISYLCTAIEGKPHKTNNIKYATYEK